MLACESLKLQQGDFTLEADLRFLFPHLTISQNVGLGLRPTLCLSADEFAKVEEFLDHVGLADMGNRKPAELSGGQQSRAA